MKRTTSLLLLVVFLQNMAFANALQPVPRGYNPNRLTLPVWISPSLSNRPGTQNVRSGLSAPSRPIIIMQNASQPSDQEAQASGPSLADVEAHPFRKTLFETAQSLRKTNVINDAEFAVIDYLGDGGEGSVNSPFVVSGVAEKSTDDAHLSSYHKRLAEKSMAALAENLHALKEKHYNAALLVFDQKFAAYETGNLSVPGYALYLDSVVPAHTPELQNLIAASLLEGSLNFQRVESERIAFMAALLSRLDNAAAANLLASTKLFKSGLISQGDYYGILQNTANEKEFSMAPYKELGLYLRYVNLCEGINHAALFDELDTLEQAAQDKLTSSDPEREIAALNKAYFLMKKLVERRLT